MTVRARTVVSVSLAVVALVLVAAWLFEWPLEKAIYLAPVLVVAFAAAAGLVVLWTRVVWESLRGSPRRRLWIAVGVGAFALIALLSALGVELPRETG